MRAITPDKQHQGKRDTGVLFAWLGLVTFGLAVASTGLLEGVERTRTDTFHQLAGQRCDPQHVAVVGIDEEALASRPDEPLVFWTPHLARSLEVLQAVGARAIGVDLLLTVSPEAWLSKAKMLEGDGARVFDRPFRQALSKGKTLLTAFATDDSAEEILLPNQDYWLSLPGLVEDVSLANLSYDDDGVVRRYRIRAAREDAPRFTLGPLLAARAEGQADDAPSWAMGGEVLTPGSELGPITFCGPAGTVPVVSIAALLAPGAAEDPTVQALGGKLVFIGATYHAAQDVHPTPYGPRLMHGVELHAQIAEAMVTGRHLRGLPLWLQALFIGVVALFGAWLFTRRQGSFKGGALTLLAMLGVFALSYLAWSVDVDLPTNGAQATLIGGWAAGLIAGLRKSERRRSEIQRMFGRYVSDDVVEHLLRSGTTPALGGETREVTVLFSDIRSFTTLSERLEADMVVEMLNVWFSRITDAIHLNGGTIDKYIGDAVMAVFGAPVAHPDHARRALAAAAEMENQVALMRDWLAKRHPDRALPPFAIGVGLHTGPAVSGNIGSSRRMEFTTIGDTVNAASRIEGLTKEMGATVLITRAVEVAAGGGLRVGASTEVQVKGRAEPLEVMAFEGFVHDRETGAETA